MESRVVKVVNVGANPCVRPDYRRRLEREGSEKRKVKSEKWSQG